MWKLKPYILLFSIVLHLPSFCQGPWSLEQCINYALENNIRIKQQKISVNYIENNYHQSKTDRYPGLNASGSYGISFGRALDQTTYQFTEDQTIKSSNMSISSSTILFNGFQKQNTIKQNYFDLQAGLYDLERLKNDVSLNIAAAYLQILFNKELLEVSKAQLELTKLQVERTRMLVESGSLARGSLLEIQAQEAAEEVQVINAENLLNLSYLSLMQILDLDVSIPFSIVIPEITSINGDDLITGPDQIFSEALGILPQIKSSSSRLKSAEKAYDTARGYRSPRLSLSASYGSGYSDIRDRIIGSEAITIPIGFTAGGEQVFATTQSPVMSTYPFINQLKDNASTSLFLSVSIPIFNGNQINNAIKNARLGMENSRLEVEFARKSLYEEITRAYTDATAALKKYNASEKALTAIEESFKYTREKYELGLVTTVDFNVAKNQLLKTQSDLLQSKYDFIFKVNILNFYRGRSLKINS